MKARPRCRSSSSLAKFSSRADSKVGRPPNSTMILSEEQVRIRHMVRDFARRQLLPHSAEWDRERKFPRDALREMGKLGLMGMTVPAEWDGAGADYVSYAIALEEIAAGDGAVSTIMSGHNSV